MEFNGTLGTYKLVKTEDGSITVHSGLFDENCHSTCGAWEETLHNYINANNIIERSLKLQQGNSPRPLTIFEVGFGIGTGLHCLLSETLKMESPQPICFFSTEIDKDFALWALTHSPLAKEFSITLEDLKISELDNNAHIIELTIHHVHIKVLIGDARKTIKVFQQVSKYPIDCIFQDAFSPRKNPSLWTWQWFKELYLNCNSQATLSTYSCAIGVRKSLWKAGFQVDNAKGFGRKRSITVCKKLDNIDNTTKEHLLLTRTKAQALDDQNLENS